MYSPLGNSLGQSHCLGSSSVIKLRLEGRCASCETVSCGKGRYAPSPNCTFWVHFGLICMLVSF